MTCNQLGGACDLEFTAETFEELAEMSKQHGVQMFQKGDTAHLEAMQKMKSMMGTPSAMAQWFADRKAEFERLPNHDAE